MNSIRQIIGFFQEVIAEWNDDKAPRLAAALAYFTIFSIAPLLIVVIAVAGVAFGQQAVRGEIVTQIQGLVGQEGAVLIEDMIANARRPNDSFIATIIGIGTLLLGAGGFFGQLQDALNTAWDVQPNPEGGILNLIKARFISFSMVLGVGFLLLVSLVLTTVLASLSNTFTQVIPGAGDTILQIVNQVISFGVVTVLFALIFKFLPDTRIEWRDVWVGAAFTSLLFSIGKYLIGLYLGTSGVASSYGAAGSLIVVLLWIFYSAQILLLGAEFTQVWSRRYGSRKGQPSSRSIVPVPNPAAAESTLYAARPGSAASPLRLLPAPAPEKTEKRLLSAGVIAYLSALIGLLMVVRRRDSGSMRR
ncbi:MAG: YihY/virulence factor BrkB family protein [bacterium]|nr:YihY/virulence factor BrkB family protein [bacterium]